MEPAKKDFLMGVLNSHLHVIVDNDDFDNVCFTYRASSKLAGQHYRIALNKKLPEELQTYLLCHEAGHIACRHVAARTTLDFEFTERKIRAVYDKLKPLFDGQDIDEMFDIFEDYIFNMLNDWEVNTKYFTEDEIAYWDSLYPPECCNGGPVKHMLPQDVGYPPGLTANEYLLLILADPEKWFVNQMAQEANKQSRKHKNGTEGGCNTNQHQPQSDDPNANANNSKNHNKQDRKKDNKQNQNGQNGNQNNQQNGQNDSSDTGTEQQNQAAANDVKDQNWKDAKSNSNSEENGENNEQQKNGSSNSTSNSNSEEKQDEQSGKGSSESKEEQGEENNSSEQSAGQSEENNEQNGSSNSDENSDKSDDADAASEGEGSDSESGEEKPQLTKEELQQLIEKFAQQIISDYKKQQQQKANAARSDSNEVVGYSRGESGAGEGTVLRDEATNWSDYDGLEKQVHELLINRTSTVTKRDLLYNYNRGRFSSDVCVPRYRTETTYDEVPMTVLLDVSCSISQTDIVGFCNIFKNVAKTMNKKCTIVLWDTELRAIFDSNDEVQPISGGGTNIGAGIEYINDNMQPSDIGNLFVVSDCEDDLEDWMNIYKGTKYLVCWSNNEIIKRYSGSLYNDFMNEFDKVLCKA